MKDMHSVTHKSSAAPWNPFYQRPVPWHSELRALAYLCRCFATSVMSRHLADGELLAMIGAAEREHSNYPNALRTLIFDAITHWAETEIEFLYADRILRILSAQ